MFQHNSDIYIFISPFRYFELVSIHGKLDPLVNVDLRPEKRVKVTFTCGSNSEVRSVDVYRTVSDLKSKLEQFAGFSAAKMRLFYVDQELRDMQVISEAPFYESTLELLNRSRKAVLFLTCPEEGMEGGGGRSEEEGYFTV